MNYIKWVLFAVIITLFLYPGVELLSSNGRIFAPSFFTSAGFVITALFISAELFTAVYTLEFAKKKKSANNAK